jgi:ABC-type enterochelin transport system substrate-binding protein
MLEVKINAKLDGERIMVNAKYLRKEKVVHEKNMAFNLGASEEEIRAEIESAGKLFELEEKQRKEQGEVDKKFEEANEIINNLNTNEKN